MAGSGSWGGGSDSGSDESYQLERHIEPFLDAFVCRLTNKVMRDPVTADNGQTFEREAIEKWFQQCNEKGVKPVCPVSKKELKSTNLRPSIALHDAIEEWTARNEAARLEIAIRSLNVATSEKAILHALRCVQYICKNSQLNKHAVGKAEVVHSIVDLLKNSNRPVRYKALETLRIVAEGNPNTKEIIAEGDTVRTVVKLTSHGQQPREKEEAVSLLYELSKSETLCDKIGSINGAILILVGMTSSKSENPVTVEKADKTLDNLSKSENNVRQMAENGRLQPLLELLLEGPVETKISMAELLGNQALNNDVKVQVARTVGSSLITLMKSDHMPSREASLRALNQISTCDISAKVLIDAGILPPLLKDLFTVGAKHLPMRLKEVSATILSNLVNSGCDFDTIILGPRNLTLVSEDIIHNLLQLISNTGPAIECKLLQVLVGLTSSPATVIKVVAAIKSLGATVSLVQFIEAPQNKDLRLACIKLLHKVSPHMSQELADALCETAGELGSLLKIILEYTGTTEEQAEAVGLLANLPEKDITLTRHILDEGAFPHIISRIRSIRQGEMMGNRYTTPYQEGLVRVLARIAYALAEEPMAVAVCKQYNVASLFVELLPSTLPDNVQIVSAWALENLSRQSHRLAHKPVVPPPGFCVSIFSCFSKPPDITGLCPVHQGICSLKDTFCLVDGQALAVEWLIALLDNPNEKAVEASLAALSTLLEDEVNIKEGVMKLNDMDGLNRILDVLVDNRNENLRRRAVWAVERFLRTDEIANIVAANQKVGTALVDAFRHGDYRTRQIAERALKHIDKIPNFSGIFSNMG
ncbi:hypothetical protein V2J09_019845 [Rumex salicifolius]